MIRQSKTLSYSLFFLLVCSVVAFWWLQGQADRTTTNKDGLTSGQPLNHRLGSDHSSNHRAPATQSIEEATTSSKSHPRVLVNQQKAGKSPHFCEDCNHEHLAGNHLSKSLQKSLNRATTHLKEIQLEGGGTAIDLDGGFQHASAASINADGEVEIHCTTSLAEIASLANAPEANDTPNEDTTR